MIHANFAPTPLDRDMFPFPTTSSQAVPRSLHWLRNLRSGQYYHSSRPNAPRPAGNSPSSPAWPCLVYSSSRLALHKSVFEAHVSLLPHDATDSSPPTRSRPGGTDNIGHSAPGSSAARVTRRLDDLFEELERLHPRTKRATHCMFAWRVVPASSATSASPTQPGGTAKRVSSRTVASSASMPSAPPPLCGSSNGGEAGAGERLERLIELSTECKNRSVVLVVYRWYGGVKLGSDRWKCISTVAKEALGIAAQKGWK